MQLSIMAVRDRVADVFGAPFCVVSVNAAKRDFANAINDVEDKSNKFAKNPDDFDLYQLGLYDDATAKIEQYESPRQVALGKELVRK